MQAAGRAAWRYPASQRHSELVSVARTFKLFVNEPNYLPIACAAHERLELAVMRRQRLLLTWIGEQDPTPRSEPVQALDVATRDGAEWLRIQRPDGQSEEVRLDRILAASEA